MIASVSLLIPLIWVWLILSVTYSYLSPIGSPSSLNIHSVSLFTCAEAFLIHKGIVRQSNIYLSIYITNFCLMLVVGWLILLSPGVVGNMGYESDPPHSYLELSNWSYYIMLNFHRFSVYSSGSFTMSWYHHLILWFVPGLCSSLTQIS